jgi:hypothetical protein
VDRAVTGWSQKLDDQWASVRNAPITFVVTAIALAVAAWSFCSFIYGSRLANRDAEIALLTRERDDYLRKLGGATPDQAKAKIEALETTVHLVIGSRWEPLSTQEVEKLALALAAVPPRFMNVFFENKLGEELAQSMLQAFKKAGWQQAYLSRGAGLGPGLSVGSGSGIAMKIKQAIESATRLRPSLENPTEPDDNTMFHISVGANVD